MKRVLVNDKNEIVYEGVDAKHKLVEGLRYEVHFDLKFRGIDDFSRPIFKDVDSVLHFGSTDYIFSNTDEQTIIDYFKKRPNELEYFGDKFNCEPNGGRQPFFRFNIL